NLHDFYKARETEVCHARESATGRKVPGLSASQPGRPIDEAFQPDARLSHGGGLLTRILLTEGCSPVGELRGALATGAGCQLLSARGCVDGRSRLHAGGPSGVGHRLPLPLRPRAEGDRGTGYRGHDISWTRRTPTTLGSRSHIRSCSMESG